MCRETLIEQMKKNRAPWFMLAPRERQMFLDAGKKNCLVVLTAHKVEEANPKTEFVFDQIYQLRPDYQPEPEIERCEVRVGGGKISYRRNGKFFYLEDATHDPGLVCFEYEDEEFYSVPRIALVNPFGSPKGKPAQIPKYVLFRKENDGLD